MGLTNLDNYVASNGVQKVGTYISFANETLYVRQAFNGTSTEPTYSVSANYRIFWDEAARTANLSYIDLKSISTSVPQSMLSENVYNCLYAELKKMYPNTENTLKGVATYPSVPQSANTSFMPPPPPVPPVTNP